MLSGGHHGPAQGLMARQSDEGASRLKEGASHGLTRAFGSMR